MTNEERRDMFAAAALAGLMSDSPDTAAQDAYRIADAMLRERTLYPKDAAYTEGVSASDASKNHDAEPAVRASGRDSSAEAGTGDTRAAQEPAAWGVYRGDYLVTAFATQEVAAAWMRAWPERGYNAVPFYAAPPASSVTLTDAEREAISNAAHLARFEVASNPSDREVWQSCYSTLRALLARLGGDA